MFTEFAIMIYIIIILIIINKNCQKKEHFLNYPNYGEQTFKWVTNPSDPKYNYISHSDNTIYVPDPAVLTNKKLYVVNA